MLVLFENVTWIDCSLDHVVVRDDVAGLVDHEARAERALRLRAAERIVLCAAVAVIRTTPGAERL